MVSRDGDNGPQGLSLMFSESEKNSRLFASFIMGRDLMKAWARDAPLPCLRRHYKENFLIIVSLVNVCRSKSCPPDD